MALTEEQQRIRGYLQSQAAKMSVPDLVEKVRGDMQQLREAAEAVPAAKFATRPAEGEWSANDVMAHVVDGGRSVGSGIVAAIDGTGRPGTVSDRMERANSEQDAAAWWSELDAGRERLFARVRAAKGDEHLDITWEHPMFGPLNWREWLLFLRIHDLDHARQVQAVTQALG
jgi:uncharacterized damage-inducible protein DinB